MLIPTHTTPQPSQLPHSGTVKKATLRVGTTLRTEIPRVRIFSDSNGSPGSSLHTFTSPSSVHEDSFGGLDQSREAVYTSSGYALTANTTYWLVIDNGGVTMSAIIASTASGDEDSSGTPGWLVGNDHRVRSGSGSWNRGSNSIRMKLEGTPGPVLVPNAPTDLEAKAYGLEVINLSWKDPVGKGGAAISGYRIEVSADSGSTWTDLVADTENLDTTYSHTGLTASTTRHYRVSAINSAGTGPPSDVASDTTWSSLRTPDAPTGLTATVRGPTIIDLSWTTPAEEGGAPVTGYKVEVSIDEGTNWTDLVADTGNRNVTYRHTGLVAGSNRHYRISAINPVGTGSPSAVVNETTTAPTAEDETDVLVSNLDQTAASLLRISTSSTHAYPNAHYATAFTTANSGTVTKATVRVATTLKTEIPRMRIFSDSNGSPGSSLHSFTSPSSVHEDTHAGLDDHREAIYTSSGYALTAHTTYWLVIDNGGVALAAIIASTASDDEDSSGRVYWSVGDSHKVRSGASGAWNNGSNSIRMKLEGSIGAFTTPLAPAELEAKAYGLQQINLSWTAPAGNGGALVTGYKIEVSSDAGSTWTDLVADTGSEETTYTATGLPHKTTRHYRVSAVNSQGTSSPSGVANATTNPSPTEHCITKPSLLWCATMTVGAFEFGNTFLGYIKSQSTGAMAPSATFDWRTATIEVISLNAVTGGVLSFIIERSAGSTPADGLLGAVDFKLVFGPDDDQTVIDMLPPRTRTSLSWSDHGLTWSEGDAVPVRLFRNIPATASASILGAARQNYVLAASLDNAVDSNGVTASEDNTTYTWQRLESDGATVVDEDIGTGRTYRLTADDVGKTIRVVARFTDDDGFAEGPFNSTPTPVIKEPFTERELVSNTGQSGTDTLPTSSWDFAQGFTTGSFSAGYVPLSVDVRYNTSGAESAPLQLALHSGSGSGPKLADFHSPTLTLDTVAPYTYHITSEVTLDPSTQYWLVFTGGNEGTQFEITGSTGEDATPLDGATIADNVRNRAIGTAADFQEPTDITIPKISIKAAKGNAPAAGLPAVAAPNVFRVPAVLSADLSGITDENGVTNLADNASYLWQRLDSSGQTVLDDDLGSDASTYRLTDADAGNTVRVTVTSRDDEGHDVGPLTSSATPAIGAAAACGAPTYTGGATQIWTGSLDIALESDSNIDYHGFTNYQDSSYGGLTPDQFTAGTSRTIIGVFIQTTNTVDGMGDATRTIDHLQFQILGGPPSDALARQLELHACDSGFRLSAATHSDVASDQIYRWSDHGLDWAPHAQRTLHISRDQAKPTAASADVTGDSLNVVFNEDLDDSVTLANSAFSGSRTPHGGSATALAFQGSPTVSGRTVTLTLTSASAILETDTDVKISYTKPTSGSGNRIIDISGNEADSFTDQPVTIDQGPPELVATNPAALASDGRTLTLTYDEAMKPGSIPASSAFTVEATPAGGTEMAYALASTDPVTISGSTVALKLEHPIPHNDTGVKVSYARPGGGAVLEDLAGNDAANLTDQPVTNNSTAPRVSITAEYDDASPGIAHAVFRVTRSNTSSSSLAVEIAITQTDDYLDATEQNISIPANQTTATGTFASDYTGNTGGTLTATLDASDGYALALAPDNAATVQMKVPGSGRVLTIAPVSFAYTVTEGTTATVTVRFTTGVGVAQPRENININVATNESGTAEFNVDYTHVSTFKTARAGDYVESGGAYTVDIPVDIVLLDDAVYEPEETFSFQVSRQPGSTGVFDLDEGCVNDGDAMDGRCTVALTLADNDTLGVTGVAVTSTATGGYYRAGDDIEVTATFNGAVTVTGAPQFSFDLGGQIRQAGYESGSDTTELVFSYTLAAGDEDLDGLSWPANSLTLNGGTIKFMHTEVAEQVNAALTHAAQGALAMHRVDTTKPTLVLAEADDTTLLLTFSEVLNTAAPALTAFTVKVDGGSGTNPTAVSISGGVVTLTLGTAISSQQTLMVSYAKPTTNPLQDLSGLEADGFTDLNVDLSDVANLTATPGSRRVTLQWDDPGDSTIRRYQYRHRNASDTGWNPGWRGMPGSNASTTSFTATGLTNGVEYTFQVRPVFLQGGVDVEGKEGEVKSIPRGPLSPPGNLAAESAGDGELSLSWDNPQDITLTGYEYRHRNTSETDWNPDWTAVPGGDSTTTAHTLTGLTNYLRYTVELRTVRGSDKGPAASRTATPRGPLTAPANLAAASGEDRRSTLTWDQAIDDSITGYQYRVRLSDGTDWQPDWTDIPGSGWTTAGYVVRNLANRTEYTLELRALRGTLEGPAARANATPEGPPSVPTAPTDLGAAGGDQTISLYWSPPADEDERAPVTAYRVRYREVDGSWRNVSRASDDDSLRQNITGLTNNQHYEVEVAAVNRVGTGPWASARATPQPPKEQTDDTGSDDSLKVTGIYAYWTDGSGSQQAHPDANGNALVLESCEGEHAFRLIWDLPNDTKPDQWEANVHTRAGTGQISYTFSPVDADLPYMLGTADLGSPARFSMRIRGRFGTTWGAWSSAVLLSCSEEG